MDSNNYNLESQAQNRANAEQQRVRVEQQRAKEKCLEHFGMIKDEFDASIKNGLDFTIKATNKTVVKNYYYKHWENYLLYLFIPFIAYLFSFFSQFSSLFIFSILTYSFIIKPSFFIGKYLRDLNCEKEELKIIESRIFPKKQGELKELFIISIVFIIISNITFYYSKVMFLSDDSINRIALNFQNFNPENELFALVNFVAITIIFGYKIMKRN